MFEIGNVIVYGAQGVCKIDSIETKQIGKTVMDYYVLKPLFNESTAVFVPTQNAALTAKMQNVLTKAEAQGLLDNAPKIDTLKYTDENDKREQYKAVLSGSNREGLVALIKTIRGERELRRVNNKKLNINDEQTLRKAELLLYNELAFVLGLEPQEVQNLIKI